MRYIVIDKDGNDISDNVRVIAQTSDDYIYCRMMADKMLQKADVFFQAEIIARYDQISNCKMEDFGPEFDPERGQKWSNRIDEIRIEIKEREAEHNEMMTIAGDWEDKEYAARWKSVVDFLAVHSDNPLQEKYVRNTLMCECLKTMGVPNLAKYIE